MKYDALLARVASYPVFDDEVLRTQGKVKASLHLQLSRLASKGKIIRLKRGLYTLPENNRKTLFSLRWLANNLYSPSYLSLEYVLGFYDLIPERVFSITSVTRNKTQTFNNLLGRFVYKHLKKELFFGFEEVDDEHRKKILMATPEKALLDTIYLNPHWQSTPDFLEKNIRLQNIESLNKKRLREYAKKFGSKKMSEACALILKMIS